MSRGVRKICWQLFQISFSGDTSSLSAATLEATIYFWHLTLELTLCNGSGPTKPRQHRSCDFLIVVLHPVNRL